MIKWVEVLIRILKLYNVRTQQELGMALAMPVSVGIGDNLENDVIPWPILEKVVLEKKVSWDWLLTGAGEPPAAGARVSSRRPPEMVDDETSREQNRPPRLETRKLERELLTNDRGAPESSVPGAETDAKDDERM